MLKKLFVLTAAALAISGSALGLAAPVAQQRAAIEAAKAEVPATCVMYGYREDEEKSVINFRDNDAFLEYEVDVVTATAKVVEVEIKGSNFAGSTQVAKSVEDIRAIVLEAYPDAQNLVIELEKEGNAQYYEAEFSTPKFIKAELKLNPVTGAIAEREHDYR
ncbi:PepSY domain-containing protein [Phascolarctobacterium sp.]|uniref:PepSY domain-containing protein n=1 Tax=Phascolarctobacterium sp. TaxID=2049039 RepID=UPI003869F0F8